MIKLVTSHETSLKNQVSKYLFLPISAFPVGSGKMSIICIVEDLTS